MPDQDESTYHGAALLPYIAGLLGRFYGTTELSKIDVLPLLDWKELSPPNVVSPLSDGDQFTMFKTSAICADEDEWETPFDVIAVVRAGLGGVIDLDPASSFLANENVRAKRFYTKQMNSLTIEWNADTIFLNPPYQKGEAAKVFTKKLADDVAAGRVKHAITLLNHQSQPTIWFRENVWPSASAHAVWNKRIQFIGKGSQFSSSQNGSTFSYFGNNPKRFCEAFSPFAMCFTPWLVE